MRAGEEQTGEPCLVERSIHVCPRKLVRFSGEDYTPEELVAKIEKNVAILNMSGGGVTFSGGECMLQIDFLAEILKKCKENGIETNFSIVDCIGEKKVNKCKKLAKEVGIPLRVREMIKDSDAT